MSRLLSDLSAVLTIRPPLMMSPNGFEADSSETSAIRSVNPIVVLCFRCSIRRRRSGHLPTPSRRSTRELLRRSWLSLPDLFET
jgi:hypothetical protein